MLYNSHSFEITENGRTRTEVPPQLSQTAINAIHEILTQEKQTTSFWHTGNVEYNGTAYQLEDGELLRLVRLINPPPVDPPLRNPHISENYKNEAEAIKIKIAQQNSASDLSILDLAQRTIREEVDKEGFIKGIKQSLQIGAHTEHKHIVTESTNENEGDLPPDLDDDDELEEVEPVENDGSTVSQILTIDEQIEKLSQAAAQLLHPDRLEALRQDMDEDNLNQQLANQMAYISSQILDVKNKIGESVYPTGLNYFCSPRFWVPFIGVGISGMSMMAFNSSIQAVVSQGDVIYTDWLSHSIKEVLFYVSGTMATNLPLNISQAVKVSFAEAMRFMPESFFGIKKIGPFELCGNEIIGEHKLSHWLGDLKLRGNFDRVEAQENMAAVIIDQSVKKRKHYIPTITWSLGSAFAFAGMGLIGGMSWDWVPSVILAFGFLSMAAMTILFLKSPKLNLNLEEKVAEALRDAKIGRLKKAVENLVPWLYNGENPDKIELLENYINVLQDLGNSEQDKAQAQTQFELIALNSILETKDKTKAIAHPSKATNVKEWFTRPASYSVFLIAGLAGYVSATMDFIHWLLDKIHKADSSSTDLTYNVIGKIFGVVFFFPFLAFVLKVLPDQASEIWKLIRHPKDSFYNRSLALRQWPGMFFIVAFSWLLVVPSTASLNFINIAFLDELYDYSSDDSSLDEQTSTGYNVMFAVLLLSAYPLTFIFNSLGITPANSMLADNATAMKGGAVSPKQMQQKIKENLERLSEFEAKKTPAAFLLELKDYKDQMGGVNFNQYCEVLFNLEEFKAFVASVFPGYEGTGKESTEKTALLANEDEEIGQSENAKIQTILAAQDFASLIDVCARGFKRSVREQVSHLSYVSYAEAAENHGLFGGKNYRGFQPEAPKQKHSCCLVM